jgi:hypothetical protein
VPDAARRADGGAPGRRQEEFILHIDHDTLLASAIQDADSPRSRSDWPLWKAAMDKETATKEGAGT